VRQVTDAMTEAMHKRGLSLVEIIAPCPTLYARLNKLGDGLDEMKRYMRNASCATAPTPRPSGSLSGPTPRSPSQVHRPRGPTHLDNMNRHYTEVFGGKYRWWGPKPQE